jgi:hypothetical protein
LFHIFLFNLGIYFESIVSSYNYHTEN